jgi:hypothetical protein
MSTVSEQVLLEDHLRRLKLPTILNQYGECARLNSKSRRSETTSRVSEPGKSHHFNQL